MKHLKSFTHISESNDNEYTDGWVINGIFFAAGFKESRFTDLPKESLDKIDLVFDTINNKYNPLCKLEGHWVYGPYAPKYGIWIPGYTFQVPFKDFNDAEIAAKELVTELKKIYNNPICIAIAEGTIKPNHKDTLMSDGTAYYKSGRWIDDPNKCLDMIRNKEDIKVL